MLKEQLKHSEKDFSENLMIVDLMRNDIGKVGEMGSVTCPLLMSRLFFLCPYIETKAT